MADEGLESLIEQAKQLIDVVNRAIEEVRVEATKMGIDPVQLRDTRGRFVMHDLLLAKAQAMRAHSGYMQLQKNVKEN